MRRYAVFVRRWDDQRGGFGRRRWIGHVQANAFLDTGAGRERAIDQARRYLARRPLVRSCDLLEVVTDNSTDRPWYGATTPAPSGVGLL